MKPISDIESIAKNLYLIRGDGHAVFPYCHTYLFEGDVLIAFDPQCGKSRLKKGIAAIGKELLDIKIVINSHFHADHTSTNSYLKKFGAKILIHEADRIALENFDEYVQRYGMIDKIIEQRWRATLKMVGFKEMKPDQTFKEGDILPEGFKVVHTPGHAPGHSCFYKAGILISGDIDLTSPWVGNLSCSIADYLDSIEKLKKMQIKLLLPAHGQPISEKIFEKLEAFRQRFLKREQKIYEILPDQPATLLQLTKRIFQSYPEEQQKQIENRQSFFAAHFGRITCLNYLIHLELQGKVKRITQNGEEYWEKIG